VNDYSFTLAGAADVLTPSLIQGELDMAAIPANLAAILHKQTEGEIQVLAVNTLGVLYIVQKDGDPIESIADLAGKTIYATSKGSTPEYTLRHLLTENGLDPDVDVTLDFKSEPAEVVSLLAQGGGIAMLPQPYVVAAQKQVEGLEIALDLTAEWDALESGSSLITGVMAVRRDFAEAHPEAIAAFLAEYEASIAYATENIAETAAFCEQYGIIPAAVAEEAIPYCNLTFLSGTTMKDALAGYLAVLHAQEAKAVGGELPADAFYYIP
jgi:NitT/TauT family transport system substrate-binding protein